MGAVYRVKHTLLGRISALKLMSPELVAKLPVAVARFQREARTAAKLKHPNIVTTHDVGQEGDHHFIDLEYVDGETLENRLESEPLSYREVLRIGSEIAEALQRAHEAGIVHRDLKPSNIMLTREGHVKVMDFGLAKRVVTDGRTEQQITASLTQAGSALGTLAYMSPEQLRGEEVDTRSGSFSFGIGLYEMLLGKHPFRRRTPMETASAILEREPFFPGASQAGPGIVLYETIQGMLAKDPDKRSQTIEEVHATLARLWEEATPRPWTRRWQFWAAGVALLAVLAVILYSLLGPQAVPKVTARTAITNDGVARDQRNLVTDGRVVYYSTERDGERRRRKKR